MEFSRPEYWSGWPFPSPGNRPNPGIESRSPVLQADSLPVEKKPKNIGMGSLSLLQPGLCKPSRSCPFVRNDYICEGTLHLEGCAFSVPVRGDDQISGNLSAEKAVT